LNNPLNITGYSLVLKQTETDLNTGEQANIIDIIGRNKIAQITVKNGTEQELYFTFDGHGSTRVLTDLAGAIVELYAFDAYGNAIGFDPSVALTEFLYSGEQFDSKIGQQYLRQRYYDPATGRFNRLDPFFGNLNDPQSLHNYLYTHADPVNGADPSGEMVAIAMGSLGGMNAQSQSAKANVGVGLQVKKGLDLLQQAQNIAETIINIAGMIEDGYSLLSIGLQGIMDFATLPDKLRQKFSETLKEGVGGRLTAKGHIPVPSTLVKVLQRNKTARGVLGFNKSQELMGLIATQLMVTSIGFETTSINYLLHGLDSVFKVTDQAVNNTGGLFKKGLFLIAESKGGNSTLKRTTNHGIQMKDKWIKDAIKKLTDSSINRNSHDIQDLHNTAKARKTIYALVVKLNVWSSVPKPAIYFSLRTFPGIKASWGYPFE
jgi:RHS repeat-associated protein